MNEKVLDKHSRKYYQTRLEVEKHRKKGEIVYYEKPCGGGYYLDKGVKKNE